MFKANFILLLIAKVIVGCNVILSWAQVELFIIFIMKLDHT